SPRHDRFVTRQTTHAYVLTFNNSCRQVLWRKNATSRKKVTDPQSNASLPFEHRTGQGDLPKGLRTTCRLLFSLMKSALGRGVSTWCTAQQRRPEATLLRSGSDRGTGVRR